MPYSRVSMCLPRLKLPRSRKLTCWWHPPSPTVEATESKPVYHTLPVSPSFLTPQLKEPILTSAVGATSFAVPLDVKNTLLLLKSNLSIIQTNIIQEKHYIQFNEVY